MTQTNRTLTGLRDKLTGAAARLGEGANGVADDLRTHAEDAWDSAQHRTKRAVREGSDYVHKNPVPMALAAFGLGLLLGAFFLSRRSPESHS